MKIRISHVVLLAALPTVLAMSFDSALAGPPAKELPAMHQAVPVVPTVKAPSAAIRTQPAAVLKAQGVAAGPSASGVIQAPMLAHCAMGFSKTGENKNVSTGALNSFECTTPVITCPTNPVFPIVSLDVHIISTNPEQTAKRIRYTCTYYPAIP